MSTTDDIKKHWSNIFGPLLQPTESRSSSAGLEGSEAKKLRQAVCSFKRHQISDEARALIDANALKKLDRVLFEQANIILPFVEKFYPDGLHDKNDLVEIIQESGINMPPEAKKPDEV